MESTIYTVIGCRDYEGCDTIKAYRTKGAAERERKRILEEKATCVRDWPRVLCTFTDDYDVEEITFFDE